MSIHGECFDNGMDGRCNVWMCEKFLEGRCETPEESFESCREDISPEYEKEIYGIYPFLLIETKQKKEIEMSKNKDAIDIQQRDRNTAANRLRELVASLTKVDRPTGEPFFDGNEKEIYSDTVHVPVKVVCLESNGMRRVYVNAHEADVETLRALASKALVDTFVGLKVTVSEIDTGLGCENLGQMVEKAISS